MNDIRIHLINTILWVNVMLHIATVIQLQNIIPRWHLLKWGTFFGTPGICYICLYIKLIWKNMSKTTSNVLYFIYMKFPIVGSHWNFFCLSTWSTWVIMISFQHFFSSFFLIPILSAFQDYYCGFASPLSLPWWFLLTQSDRKAQTYFIICLVWNIEFIIIGP